jgi:hypothetical protein
MYSTFDAKARYLQLTGKRMRRNNKRRRTKNSARSKKVEALFSAEWDSAFMSMIQLQGLLDRTKADEQDEATMDMTTIDGIRMSKYDIRVLKVGSKVSPEMREELNQFNKNFVGELKTACFPSRMAHHAS